MVDVLDPNRTQKRMTQPQFWHNYNKVPIGYIKYLGYIIAREVRKVKVEALEGVSEQSSDQQA